jgi:putative oxidoreductase
MLRKILTASTLGKGSDLSILLLRIVSGYAMALHGWGKIQNPFAWMGEESAIPAFLQALAALSEFGGGIALILGLLTRIASFGIACTMVGAVYLHAIVLGDPFVSSGKGGAYELALLYLLISLHFMLTGPGKYSLDYKFLTKPPPA